jgi:hypothetical protein
VERSLKRKLAAGVTGLLVLGGGGAAYAVTNSNDNGRQAFLGDVAKRLNVTPDQLNSALKGAFADRLQAAVKAGKLTQAQADKIKKQVQQNGGPPGFGGDLRAFGAGGGPHFFHRGGPGGPGGPIRAGVGAAAKYLGLTDQQLIGQIRSGKSLADIAGDKNKSVDGLKSAIKDSVKSDLDADVKAGRLTQSQENAIVGKLDGRLDDLVNHKGFIGPERGLHRGGPLVGKPGARNGRPAVPPGAPAPPPGAPIM